VDINPKMLDKGRSVWKFQTPFSTGMFPTGLTHRILIFAINFIELEIPCFLSTLLIFPSYPKALTFHRCEHC